MWAISLSMAAVVSIFLLIYLGSSECNFYASSNINLDNDGRTILLGGLFPVHGPSSDQLCGDLREIGVQEVEAMVFAVKSINKNLELLPNLTLAFDIRDSCANPSHAVKQAFKFVQNTNASCLNTGNRVAVSGVVGAQRSSVSIGLANLFRLYSIPQISHTSSSDQLSDKTRFEYFLRTVPPDSLQSRVIADIIIRFNWTYVFALYSDDSYGIGGISNIFEMLKSSMDICFAVNIPVSVTASPSDFDAILKNMSRQWVQNASVAVLFTHLDGAKGAMDALLRFKASPDGDRLRDITWIGTDGWGDLLPSEYHKLARGMLSTTPRSKESLEFDKYFTSLHPLNYTENVWFNEFWEQRFNCSLTNRTNAMPCDVSNESIALSLEDHKQFTRTTLLLDGVYAFAHALHSMITNRCPNFSLCPDVMTSLPTGEAVNGEILRDYLYNVSFQGPSTNNVTFNARGDKPGAYFIKNLKTVSAAENKYSFETIGTWYENGGLELDPDEIEWASNDTIPESYCSRPCSGGQQPILIANQPHCCWTCVACESEKGFSNGLDACTNCNKTHMPNEERTECVPIPVSYLRWEDPWAIALTLITLCGLLATAAITIVFILFRNNKVIKASSREVSAVLLVGLFLCYIMPFPLLAKPSDAVCAIRRFGVGFSFAVCYSALLIKTNRIHRIFNNSMLKPNKVPPLTSPLSQVLLSVAVISIQVLIAIVWLAVEQPSTDIRYSTRSAELRCGESPTIGLFITLSFNLVLLLASTYFAFRTRKVPENFNEAKYINVTLYTLCIVWLAFVPTYFITGKFAMAFQPASLVIAITLSASTTLVCLFVPKLFLLYSKTGKGKVAAEVSFTTSTLQQVKQA